MLGSDHLPVILRLPLARTSRAALIKVSFSHVAGCLCSIDGTRLKVNGVRDQFFSKAVKHSQGMAGFDAPGSDHMDDAQVKEVYY